MSELTDPKRYELNNFLKVATPTKPLQLRDLLMSPKRVTSNKKARSPPRKSPNRIYIGADTDYFTRPPENLELPFLSARAEYNHLTDTLSTRVSIQSPHMRLKKLNLNVQNSPTRSKGNPSPIEHIERDLSLTLNMNKSLFNKISFTDQKSVFRDQKLNILRNSAALNELIQSEPPGPTPNKAIAVNKLIHSLSSEEGLYQEQMIMISQEIDSSIFCPLKLLKDVQLDRRFRAYFYEIIDLKGQFGLVPYFEVVKSLLQKLENKEMEMIESRDTHAKIIEDLKHEYQHKETHLKKSIEEKVKIISDLEFRFGDSKESLQKDFEKEKELLQRELNFFKENFENPESSEKKINTNGFMDQIKNLAQENISIEDRYHKLEQNFQSLKESFLELLQGYKKSLVTIQSSKELAKKAEADVLRLTKENERLFIKALAAQDHHKLTPRPNFKPLQEYFRVRKDMGDTSKELVEKMAKMSKVKIPRFIAKQENQE